MSLLAKLVNIIYRVFLRFTLLGTHNTNKITPDEYDTLMDEYIKKHPEITVQESKDLLVVK